MRLRSILAAAAGASSVAFGIVPAFASIPAWRAVPLPAAASGIGELSNVSALGPADAWAAGIDLNNDAILLHWNGKAWSAARTTGLQAGVGLADIEARSDRNILVGSADPVTGSDTVYHFNGSRWTNIPRPRIADIAGYASYSGFFGPGGQIWAEASIRGRLAFFKLTAPGWRVYRTGVLGGVVSFADLPVFLTPDDGWAAGSSWDMASQHDRPWLLHFDGKKWSRAVSPPLPRAALSTTFDGIVAVRGQQGDRLWLSGNWQPCSPVGGSCASTPFVVSGRGGRWTPERLPARVIAVSGLSPGRSGLPQWIDTTTSDDSASYYLRFTRGAWALVRGVRIAGHFDPGMTVAHIPGTDSTWSAGADRFGEDPLQVSPRIELNGDLP